MDKLIKAAFNDFRLIFRDNSLKVFLLLPLITLPIIRYGLPYVVAIYDTLQDYIGVILMLASMQGSAVFGFIYSMVLVDEKDTSVGKVYGVLPISKFWFTTARLVPPYLLAAAATFLLLLVEPFYDLPAGPIFVYSILAGVVSPLMVIFVATVASNKIEAMTWQKLFNIPLYLPIGSFFVPASISPIFAVFPTYWSYLTLDSIIRGGSFTLSVVVGFVYSILLTAILIRRFIRDHYQ